MTAHLQPIQLIALNNLVSSPRNVRKQDRKADIDALAASIAAHGLLQNLCVVPTEGDKYEVDAGGRRLAALKQLAKQKVIAKGNGQEKTFAFEISLFDKALVEAGGWVEYADARY